MYRKLGAKQIKAARLVAWGRSAVEISKLLGVSPHTLSRWKKIPEFIAECEKVINEQNEEMRYRTANLASSSIDLVWSELQDKSPSSRRLSVAMNLVKLLGIEQIMTQKMSKSAGAIPKAQETID